MTKLPRSYLYYAVSVVREMKAADEESNWDRRNRATGEQYCVHGTNIGTWDGPDYMCGWCEDGATIYQYALYWAWRRYRDDQRKARKEWTEALIDTMIKAEFAHKVGALTDDEHKAFQTHAAHAVGASLTAKR